MDPSVASASVHRQPYLFWAARASGGPRQGDSAAKPDPPQPSYLRHPALGQPVSRDRGRYALPPGQGQDPFGRAEDLLGLRPRPLEIEALEFVGDLDHAARVDDVVGRVQYAVILEQLVHARVSELVVGAAADDSCAERGD